MLLQKKIPWKLSGNLPETFRPFATLLDLHTSRTLRLWPTPPTRFILTSISQICYTFSWFMNCSLYVSLPATVFGLVHEVQLAICPCPSIYYTVQ